MIWNDKRTPAGHVTDTSTGMTGSMRSIPPQDHRVMMSQIDHMQRSQDAARAAGGARPVEPWNTPGVNRAFRNAGLR